MFGYLQNIFETVVTIFEGLSTFLRLVQNFYLRRCLDADFGLSLFFLTLCLAREALGFEFLLTSGGGLDCPGQHVCDASNDNSESLNPIVLTPALLARFPGIPPG